MMQREEEAKPNVEEACVPAADLEGCWISAAGCPPFCILAIHKNTAVGPDRLKEVGLVCVFSAMLFPFVEYRGRMAPLSNRFRLEPDTCSRSCDPRVACVIQLCCRVFGKFVDVLNYDDRKCNVNNDCLCTMRIC